MLKEHTAQKMTFHKDIVIAKFELIKDLIIPSALSTHFDQSLYNSLANVDNALHF